MLHIGTHYAEQMQDISLRPDFHVLKYLRQNDLLARKEYENAVKYSERVPCDHLVPAGYRTPEMRRKENKSNEQRHDLGKERRTMRKERRNHK